MSDYYVYAVRYNSSHSHIDELKVVLSGASTYSYFKRQFVVERILSRADTFTTAVQGSNGEYYEGAKVIIDPVEGILYLKTVADWTTKDNLGNLPEY